MITAGPLPALDAASLPWTPPQDSFWYPGRAVDLGGHRGTCGAGELDRTHTRHQLIQRRALAAPAMQPPC